MNVLLDSCVWGGAGKALAEAGHDVEWVGDWKPDPGDEEILRIAMERKAVLVTLDKDFGEIAIVRRVHHTGIIRIVGLPASQQGAVCALMLDRYGEELRSGAIVTVSEQRARVRPWQE